MRELTGKSEEELFSDLKGVIFLNPLYGYGNVTEQKYLMADEYLSGNVREKLITAQKSAEVYPEDYKINVEALEKVQPKDLTASEISVRLGATWIPPEIFEKFMFEFLDTPRYAQWNIKVHYSQYTGEWNIEGKSYDRSNVKAYSTYGTSRINASILYTQLFQQLFYAADHIHGGSLPVPVHFLMDEFANVSLPDDFDKILSVMRSRGVSVSIILQNLAQLKALFEKQWESIVGNCDEFLYLGGNEQSTHKYVSELLGKETIDTNTYGKSSGRSGNYSTNYQISGRELLTPDEVRMLDNQYAILFIRGERPVMDFKYDILKHPNVVLTTDGKASAYKHGEVTVKHSSISVLSLDPKELPEENYGETTYELLSDEDFEVNKNIY